MATDPFSGVFSLKEGLYRRRFAKCENLKPAPRPVLRMGKGVDSSEDEAHLAGRFEIRSEGENFVR